MKHKSHRQPTVVTPTPEPVVPRPSVDAGDKAESPREKKAVTSFGVLIAHVIWFFLGPLTLMLLLLGIINVGGGWASALDAVFFVVIALMILGRWIDQRSGQGTTGYGEPSTWDDFRRYAIGAPILGVAAWIVANVIGNHFF